MALSGILARNLKYLGLVRFESYFGHTAYAHLFVTDAMREHLVKEWDLQYILTSLFLYKLT